MLSRALRTEALALCNAGDREGLAAFVASTRGFRFARLGGRSLPEFALVAAIRHGHWALLDDVLTRYEPAPETILGAVLVPLDHPTQTTIDDQWVEGVGRAVREHLVPLMPRRDTVLETAIRAGAWSVVLALSGRGTLGMYLFGVGLGAPWAEVWFPLLLARADDATLANLPRRYERWPPQYSAWIEAETLKRERARDTAVMQAAHPQLGADSALSRLSGDVLREVVRHTRAPI